MITTKALTILALTTGAALSLSSSFSSNASAHGLPMGGAHLPFPSGVAHLPPSIGRFPPGRLAGAFNNHPVSGAPVQPNGGHGGGPNGGHGSWHHGPTWGGGYWGGYAYGYPVTYSTGEACPVGEFLNYWGHCRPLPY